MRARSLLSALLVSTGVYAGTDLVDRPPTVSEVVPVSYQSAHRNIVAGLRACVGHDEIVAGTVYTEDRFADLRIWQHGPNTALLAYVEIQAIDGSTSRINAWHSKPAFGDGITRFAKAAPGLAVAGAKADCTVLKSWD